MTPGSLKGLQVVVQDVDGARRLLVDRGVDASPVEAFPWGSFTYFSDPDGNIWAVQQLPRRPQS